MSNQFTASCACGKVRFVATAPPIVRLLCYCDDCQAAQAIVDALPGGKSGKTSQGATDSILFRRDQVRCVSGEEHLKALKLRPESSTTRMLPTCCNSLMGNYFSNWWPHVALRTFAAPAPSFAPKFQIFTKFATASCAPSDDLPQYATIPMSFGLQLIGVALQLRLRGNPPLTFQAR